MDIKVFHYEDDSNLPYDVTDYLNVHSVTFDSHNQTLFFVDENGNGQQVTHNHAIHIEFSISNK